MAQKEMDYCRANMFFMRGEEVEKTLSFLSLPFSAGKSQWDAGGLEDPHLLLIQLPGGAVGHSRCDPYCLMLYILDLSRNYQTSPRFRAELAGSSSRKQSRHSWHASSDAGGSWQLAAEDAVTAPTKEPV